MDEILAATLGGAVYGHLDYLNNLVATADERSLSALSGTEIVRLTETVREMLAQHEPDGHGHCRQCSGWFRRRRHPCSVWTTAHQHLIGPGDTISATQKSGETTMDNLRTDQYTQVGRDCPMSVDLQPADDLVEIVLGECRFSGALRLQIGHPDTCARLAEAIANARDQLVDHLHANASAGPAMSQLDSELTAPVASWAKQA